MIVEEYRFEPNRSDTLQQPEHKIYEFTYIDIC